MNATVTDATLNKPGQHNANRSLKRISVVTPCYNAEKYIRDTIKSVLSNTLIASSALQLQYIICDGGSKDKTLDIAREAFASYRGGNVQSRIISEPDRGMYDALAKGLRLATGDVCSYINAGDLYSPTAFEVVVELLSRRDVSWITGLTAWYNEKNHLVNCTLPFRYRSRLVRCGMYGTVLPFIQQESTFWVTELNAGVDFDRLASFRYAGDFYLWQRFSRMAQLYVVSAWLGGFKFHQGQLSENSGDYSREMNEIADRATALDYLLAFIDKPLWMMPNAIKRSVAKKAMFTFDHRLQCYIRGSHAG